ncbi:MAG: ribonuclease Y, partial [Patescibacteria group bacterium]
AFGLVLGYFVRQLIAKSQLNSAETKIFSLLSQSKNEAQEILLSAKKKAVELLDEAKIEEKERLKQVSRTEERLLKKEETLEKEHDQLKNDENALVQKIEKVRAIKENLENLEKQKLEELLKISKTSYEDAKKSLFDQLEIVHKSELAARVQKLEQEGKETLEKKAQEILASALQRYSASQISELTTTTVGIPSDDLKGKIIGKEGRNIRTLERLTGVEIIVDETPETVIISGFDPVRRQIAKIALDKLIADGRIQPAKIEEMVEKAKTEMDKKIKEAGEAAVYDVGILDLEPRLVHLLGRLKYRTSYGQNVLMHSVEAAHISGMIASEIGADVAVCKKAGLLHDIGKAVDHEVEGSHVEIGKKILEKFRVSEAVIKAMQAHHGEYPFETLESVIVQVAEAISAARPGARSDTLENYIKRLENLEKISNSFEGVEKSY